jgi:hypothetical protein
MQPKTPQAPSPKNPKLRHVADPVLLDFLSQDAAPTAPDLRLGIVKLALSQIAHWRGYDRLSLIFHYGDENTVKSICLAASHLREDDLDFFLVDDEEDYKRALRRLGLVTKEPNYDGFTRHKSAISDETMLRIIEVAGDVLDWDGGEPEYRTYVTPAWPVLADEYEYECAGGDNPWLRLHLDDPCNDRPSGPATGSELLALEREEQRHVTHGSERMYRKHGCRCSTCRAWKRREKADVKEKARGWM